MENNYDLDRILSDEKLRDFIIGLKEYSSSKPEDDTERWDALKSYYESPYTSLKIKTRIKELAT
jgi:hypothetical protein